MRTSAFGFMLVLACLVLWPVDALAQSEIAGVVKDASGSVLPGVTVEASSPALIEKSRAAVTDGDGNYRIISLRPGVYTVTFSLPGFSTVSRQGIELTSNFAASVNAEMKVGGIEETITVTGESPIVDTQSITARTVMTREVLDLLPTGRNIQAVGIMIPGTALALGGGGALSRDVGGSGSLQQSPLQYRGSGDTVQTIEGLRLNNLEAQGQYSGVYWNDASFEELSYITGADSAEMGQGGLRVNMVPRDGGNTFRGQAFGNFTDSSWSSDNCELSRRWSALRTLEPDRQHDVQSEQPPDERLRDSEDLGFQSVDRRARSFATSSGSTTRSGTRASRRRPPTATSIATPRSSSTTPTPIGQASTTATSSATRCACRGRRAARTRSRSITTTSGSTAITGASPPTVPPEAAGVQVTPTSFVNVSKWTRTQTSRLLLEGGFGYYNQEYTELYQPSVTGLDDKVFDPAAISNARPVHRPRSIEQQDRERLERAGGSLLETSDLHGRGLVRHRLAFLPARRHGEQGDWRLLEQWTGDMQPITYNAGRPVQTTLRLPTDRSNGIKADTGIFLQDRWTMSRLTWNLGLRYDQFIGETQESEVHAEPFQQRT